MSETLKFKIKDGEFWYSGCIDDTVNMPYSSKSNVSFNAINNHSYNQVNPVLLSTKGRYIYAKDYFILDISNGVIQLTSPSHIDFGEKSTLKEAYTYIKDKYYAFDGRYPEEYLFIKPQYCTWMAFGENQTQEGVINFAKSILDAGMPSGEIIIDDGWTDYCGQFEFSKVKFPDPKKMCDELKELGFKVVVWVVPYVSPDSYNYRELNRNDLLIKEQNGEAFITHWWDGYSACIDLSNPEGVKWYKDKVQNLISKYGVVGVKMDGGDPRLYKDNLVTFDKEVGKTANGIAEMYGRLASEFSVSEIRSTAKCGGLPVMQRIADRYHTWEDEKNGFDGIVKKSLVMSLFGYPYNCPDMVGGGQFEDIENGKTDDEELNIRYMEAATFMPSLQFSRMLWQKGGLTKQVIINMLAIREKYSEYIFECVKYCAKTGTPIIRTMTYAYNIMPNNTEQFMLGERLLISPVIKKGQTQKEVYLPSGTWKYEPTGKIYEGNQTVTVSAPVEVLPYFVKL